jgi:hypothetical protein
MAEVQTDADPSSWKKRQKSTSSAIVEPRDITFSTATDKPGATLSQNSAKVRR